MIKKLTRREWNKLEAFHVFPWMGDPKMPIMEVLRPTVKVLRRMRNPTYPSHIFTDGFADILYGELLRAADAWRDDKEYYFDPGFTLKQILGDKALLQENEPILWVRVFLANSYKSRGGKFPLSGGVSAYDEHGSVYLSFNPGQTIARCSWTVMHEMWHIMDVQRGRKLVGSTRILREKGRAAYENLPTERRAQAYACSHMFRLGWGYGRKMTCQQLWDSI
jgi:hypothetical protein